MASSISQMKLSTRYAIVGIAALSVLSLVHWCRGMRFEAQGIVLELMGSLPNAAAAIAIPFVLLSIQADRKPDATHQESRWFFIWLTIFSGFGLIVWEFMQSSSRSLVFDTHDIAATLIGLILARLLFYLLTPGEN